MSLPSRFSRRLRQREILALYRMVVGVLFTCHGVADLFGVLGGSHQAPGHAVAFATWPAGGPRRSSSPAVCSSRSAS